MTVTDNDVNWFTQDGAVTAAGASRSQAGPLLGVRCRRAAVTDGDVHSHRPLARLHLVRHRQLRATQLTAADRLAGRAGQSDQAVLSVPQQQLRWSSDPIQVHHRSLLHVQQSHFGRVWQRRAQHQLREDLLRMRHAHRMYVPDFHFFFSHFYNNNTYHHHY